MADFEFTSVETFGINFPRWQKLVLPSTTIQDEFAKTKAIEVNPEANMEGSGPNASLGFEWYEWLAEAPCAAPDCYTPEEKVEYAARMFSWKFPQLKMVIHSVRFDKSDDESDFYTDGFVFEIEFY